MTPRRPSTPPGPGASRSFRFPAWERRRLDNGLELLLAPLERVPLVQFELTTAAGGHHDPPGRAGLATFCAALLDEGTDARTALEIAAEIEGLGGYLATRADWDAGLIGVGLGADSAERGLRLLAEVATRPSFPEAEIERLRGRRLAELQRRLAMPGLLAERVLARALYGPSPYGASLLGDATSTKRLQRDEIVAFYRRQVAPSGAALIAVGDLDADAVHTWAAATLGAWRGPVPPPPPPIEPPPADGLRVHLVDRPGAVQTELRLGHPGVPRAHPDFVPLRVLNSLLGGKFTSRINLNLRERHGFTYGASSRFASRRGPGPFTVSTSVANESVGRAVEEILGEMRRLRDEAVTPPELEETKSYLLGVFPFTAQTIANVAGRLAELAIHSLPDDYYSSYPSTVAAVTPERIGELARRHLHPGRVTLAAAGPAASLRPQLESLGEVEVLPAPTAAEDWPPDPRPTRT